jgi:hypothetical protein
MQKRDHYLDIISVIASFEYQVFDVLAHPCRHLLSLKLVIQEHPGEKVALFSVIIHVDLQTITLLHSKFVGSVQSSYLPVFYDTN